MSHLTGGIEGGGRVRGQLPWILKQAGLWRIKGGSLHIQNIKYMNTSLQGKTGKYSPSHIPLILSLRLPPCPTTGYAMKTCDLSWVGTQAVGTRQAVLWEPWFSLILYLDTVLVCTPLNIRSNIPLFTQIEKLLKDCGSESSTCDSIHFFQGWKYKRASFRLILKYYCVIFKAIPSFNPPNLHSYLTNAWISN